MMKHILTVLCLAWTLTAAWGEDEAPKKPSEDLTQMSIEDLMKVKVTTASKKAEPLSQTPAAIYVITQEDIRRSGATTLPELLRMVPGVQVAQIDANKWAVGVRGFNGRFSSKLLVLRDGRTLYTPLFSGVFWDVQDVLLEDVERIEVIRGPGGSLWGANAVNGIINIISKSAAETQGNLLMPQGIGNAKRGFGSLRHGGTWGGQGHYRVYGKYFTRDHLVDATGAQAPDGWSMMRGGFRLDRGKPETSQFTLQGDVYGGDVGQRLNISTLVPPFSQTFDEKFSVSGWNVLARWERKTSERSQTTVQVYFDKTRRDAFDANENRDTFDLDLQQQVALNQRHNLLWGLGYRRTSDQTQPNSIAAFTPAQRTDNLFSAFVQDDVTLKKNLRLSLGSKFERNDYTGFEFQPNARLLWTPDERRTGWASITRAVRTPSRINHDVRAMLAAFPAEDGTPVVIALVGDRGFKSEEVVAHEIGYRFQPNHRIFIDATAFYNIYNNLPSFEPDAPFIEMNPLPVHVVVPLRFDNKLHGKVYGFEVAGNWNVSPRWKLAFGYALLQSKLRFDPSSRDTSPLLFNSPRQQLHLRSYLDLSHHLELDTLLFAVGKLPGTSLPGYARLDVRLGWRPRENVEVSLIAQNLFNHRHQELEAFYVEQPSRVERGIYGKITWRFR